MMKLLAIVLARRKDSAVSFVNHNSEQLFMISVLDILQRIS